MAYGCVITNIECITSCSWWI